MNPEPPEHIDAGPVRLVRTRPEHAGAVARAVAESLEHLEPWMPWAGADAARAAFQEARLRQAGAAWDAGTEFGYHLELEGEPARVVGALGLHRRVGPGGIEIGYWTHAAHAGRGYMTAAAGAAADMATGLPGIDRVEIHTDEANVRSAAIPPKLGFRLARVDVRDPQAPAESGRLQIWVRP